MSEENQNKYECKNIEDYKTAFKCFKQRFLEEKKSIFRLDSDEQILNTDSVQYLVDNFVNNGLGGKDAFIDKMRIQLVEDSNLIDTNKFIQKNAIEVLAHIIWLWRLVPSNAKMDSTISSVKEVLDLNEELKKIELKKNPFFNEKIKGIASTGTYYNTNKPSEIAFVIKFLNDYLNQKEQDQQVFIEILTEKENYNKVTISGEKDLENSQIVDGKKGSLERSASIFHALLHFFDPDKYEAIVSMGHKEAIVTTFKDLICEDEEENFNPEIDWKIKCIKNKLGGDTHKGIYFFYLPHIRKLWDSKSLEVNKNIIYYGVPGTGKTYGILQELQNQENIEFKFVQFHPSYGYEDFIEGIKPIKSDSKDIKLELVNGEFKQMCIEAFKELQNADKEKREPKKYYFIADEINRAELSRVFGELLVCIEEDKRIRIKDGKIDTNSLLIKTQYSSMWEDKHIVVKTNDKLELDENGERYFGVPENIYFIGTMNDVDRSIESFDLALRRRFTWIKKETSYKVIKDKYDENFKRSCVNLNKKIATIIGKNYQLGHSYFLKAIQINGKVPNISKKILFDTELKPILEEYLRSIVDESQIDEKMNELKKVFIPEDKNDTAN